MAFHLPVSTPPNALVAGYANIRTKDMVSCSHFYNIFMSICVKCFSFFFLLGHCWYRSNHYDYDCIVYILSNVGFGSLS